MKIKEDFKEMLKLIKKIKIKQKKANQAEK